MCHVHPLNRLLTVNEILVLSNLSVSPFCTVFRLISLIFYLKYFTTWKAKIICTKGQVTDWLKIFPKYTLNLHVCRVYNISTNTKILKKNIQTFKKYFIFSTVVDTMTDKHVHAMFVLSNFGRNKKRTLIAYNCIICTYRACLLISIQLSLTLYKPVAKR